MQLLAAYGLPRSWIRVITHASRHVQGLNLAFFKPGLFAENGLLQVFAKHGGLVGIF